MQVTESIARSNVCPIIVGSEGIPGMCRASDCMAWRWVREIVQKDEDTDYYTKTGLFDHDGTSTHGYCGLAGGIT